MHSRAPLARMSTLQAERVEYRGILFVLAEHDVTPVTATVSHRHAVRHGGRAEDHVAIGGLVLAVMAAVAADVGREVRITVPDELAVGPDVAEPNRGDCLGGLARASAFLGQTENVNTFLSQFKAEIEERLVRIYHGFMHLKKAGFAVDCIEPQAAIYLTVKIDLAGKQTPDGGILQNQEDVTAYLLSEAKLALVPFYAFGAPRTSPWYRLSVGTCKKDDIDEMLKKLGDALSRLSDVPAS